MCAMKAVVCPRYGPPEVLEIREVSDPIPRDAELLIRVHATTVTSGDARVRALRMPSPVFSLIGRLALGMRGPRRAVLGTELAGVVEQVGARVTKFRIGDPVVAFVGVRFGAHAELVCVPEAAPVVRKPERLSYEEAVAIPFGAMTALYFLRDLAAVKPGQRVLVVGASGAVGVAAVQLAVHLGAEVDGVCSTTKVELVRSLGARRVFDYSTGDFTQSAAGYDVVLDTVGVTALAKCRRTLKPTGKFLAVVLTGTELWELVSTRLIGGQRVLSGVAPERLTDLQYVMGLAESGQLKPIIDQHYSMREIVAAHRRVDTGRKVGAVVVSMNEREFSGVRH